MGAYVYRITPVRVLCSDGAEANVAVYAYKPTNTESFDYKRRRYISPGTVNRRWHFETGCDKASKMASEGRFTGRAVMASRDGKVAPESPVIVLPKTWGTFEDDSIGTPHCAARYLLGVTAGGTLRKTDDTATTQS